MAFDVAVSLFKQDGLGDWQEDRNERKHFFSMNASGAGTSREEMFRYLRKKEEFKEGSGDKNFDVIKAFFHQPSLKIEDASLSYKVSSSSDLAVIEVRGKSVSTWNGRRNVRFQEKVLAETDKKIKRSFAGSLQKENESVYKIFSSRELLAFAKDPLLQTFALSDLRAVRTYSESYMGVQTVYSVAEKEAVIGECKQENLLKGFYKDPFNGFFDIPKGENF